MSASGDRRVAPAWTLGVLAGGKSRRMGQDKASLPFGRGTLLDHVISRYASEGVPVRVSSRPGGAGTAGPYPCVFDAVPDAGPLAGILALLQDLDTPFLFAMPCDLPLLPPDLGDRLLGHARGADAVLCSLEDGLQPLPVLLSVEIRPILRELMDQGERKADAYLSHAPCSLVPFAKLCPEVEPEVAWTNVNDPASLELARRLHGDSLAR